MGTEEEAREKFAEFLRRGDASEPQFVGDKNVVISRAEYQRLEALDEDETPTGKWLVRSLAGLGEIALPSRKEDRPSPFEGWSDREFGE